MKLVFRKYDGTKVSTELELHEEIAEISDTGVLGYAIARIAELETAIKKHRAQTGNNLCWENDIELWSVLKDGQTAYPHETLPCREEFLHNCRAYYESRLINIRIPNENKS